MTAGSSHRRVRSNATWLFAAAVTAWSLCSCLLTTPLEGLADGEPRGELPDAESRDTATCTKSCFGQCVGALDPSYGCANASCTACLLPHAKAACAGGSCSVAVCETGYADCDGRPENGCESDLSKPETCGQCNRVCGGTEFCTPAGATFACSADCAPPLKGCGRQCVDTTSTPAHCGACDRPCLVAGPGMTVSCAASTCNVTCAAGMHLCGSVATGTAACASNLDVDRCGSSCAVCPTRANAARTCTNAQCSFTCNQGALDCNRVASDGCEYVGTSCPGITCNVCYSSGGACGCGGSGRCCVATGVCTPQSACGSFQD